MPSLRACSTARATASCEPEITVWRGPFQLTGITPTIP